MFSIGDKMGDGGLTTRLWMADVCFVEKPVVLSSMLFTGSLCKTFDRSDLSPFGKQHSLRIILIEIDFDDEAGRDLRNRRDESMDCQRGFVDAA